LGRVGLLSGIATVAIVVLSSSALVLFYILFHPDVYPLGAALPVQALGGILVTGCIFAVLNATLEELVFRGVLLDALESQWESVWAVILTAGMFGFGHLAGYPSGLVGVILAGL
jgi:membrane protease YdiL (CAAX protease family)